MAYVARYMIPSRGGRLIEIRYPTAPEPQGLGETRPHGMHGLTVFGYALMPVKLVPSYELNSSTALWTAWESQGLRKKTLTENQI